MRVRYTHQALLDLAEIHDYIAAENADAASRVFAEIEHEIQQLKAHPRLGRPGRVEETRELVISRFPYVIAYRLPDAMPECETPAGSAAEAVIAISAERQGGGTWPTI